MSVKLFKDRVSFEERKQEADKKRTQYPTLIPIIIEKHKKAKLPVLEKIKFLVSKDLKLFELQQSIRKKLKLNKEESLFFFIGGSQLDKIGLVINYYSKSYLDSLLSEIYDRSKNEDGFLYIEYANVASFG